MAAVNPPYVLQAATASHTAKLFRRVLEGLLTEGVCETNSTDDLHVKQNSPAAMSVLVEKGMAFIEGDDSADQGVYLVYNDADAAVTIAAADATNPRIDIIIAQIKDATEGGAAGDVWTLDKVTGTPAGSPSVPTTPDSALKLAEVNVAALATTIVDANIDDTRTIFGSSGLTNSLHNTFIGFRAQKSSPQAFADQTAEKVTWSSIDYDTDSIMNLSNERLVVPTGMDGYWDIRANLGWEGAGTGNRRRIYLYKNGTNYRSRSVEPAGSTQVTSGIWATLELAEGDYIEVWGWQDSGGGLDVEASSGTPSDTHFQAEYRGK